MDPLEYIPDRVAIDILDQSPRREGEQLMMDEYDYHCGRKYGRAEWMLLRRNAKDALGITITFREILRLKYKEKDLKRMIKSCFKDIEIDKHTFRMVLIPEYDNTGNFHYHGIFKGIKRNQLAKLKRQLSAHIGFFKIEKQIKNIWNWMLYCVKEIDEDFDETLMIISKRIEG